MLVRNARQELQVAVDDRRVYGHAREENHAGVRHPEQHEHRELPLLVVRQAVDPREQLLVDAEPGHDHDRAGGEAIREELAE